MESKQQPPYPLRISPDLRRRLEEAADASRRSLNAEISERLERSFEASGVPDAALMARLAKAEYESAFQELELYAALSDHAKTARALIAIADAVPRESSAALGGDHELADAIQVATDAIEFLDGVHKEYRPDAALASATEAEARLAAAKDALMAAAEADVRRRAARVVLIGNADVGGKPGDAQSAYSAYSIIRRGEVGTKPLAPNAGPKASPNARKRPPSKP